MPMLCALLFVAAACATPRAAPQHPIKPHDATVVVKDVYISTPTPVPAAEIADGQQTLAPQRAVVELTVNVALDCDPTAFSVEELEGSILGSNGIDRAVTYFVPQVAAERCKPAAPRDYVLSQTWTRRSDTPWTIVVTPYAGQTDRVAGTALFARDLAGHAETRPPRTDAISVTTTGDSLTNGPEIRRVAARRDGGVLAIKLDLIYGNQCLAREPWGFDVASSREGDATFLWATLVRAGAAACGEIFQPTPASVEYRVPLPVDARMVSLVIPNLRTKHALPIFHETFR